MKQNRVKEIQGYLKEHGIKVSETAIVNAAIDLACRLGAGKYTFVCEFEGERKGDIVDED
jgi:uncharacterized protein with GYD domain